MIKSKNIFIIFMILSYFTSCNKESDSTNIEDKVCEKTCEKNFILNTDDCSCEEVVVKTCEKTCEEGFVLDENTCSCEEKPVKACEKTCEKGYTLRAESCKCEKDVVVFKPSVIKYETETVTLVGDWKLKTDIVGYQGTGYIVWEGKSSFQNPNPLHVLNYKVNVEKAGTYAFKWRSYIAKIDPSEGAGGHNDSWISFPDADAVFAIRNKEGEAFSRKVPSSKKNYFFKAYMNTLNKWNNWCGTIDFKPHVIYATFNAPGTYTVSIAPRSDYHAIDGFTLTEVASDLRLK